MTLLVVRAYEEEGKENNYMALRVSTEQLLSKQNSHIH